MQLVRSAVWLFALSVLGTAACGGESNSSDDDSDDGTGGTTATGGTRSTGGSSARGGTSGSSGSSGSSSGGAGGMEPPDGVCEDITACGGDPTGTWDVRENCAETLVPIFADTPGCEHVMAAASIAFEGAFGFQDGVATQNVSSTVNFTTTIDDPCAEALIGLPGVTAADACPLINLEFMMNPDTSGTCSAVTEGCRCDGVQSEPAMEQSDTYQIVDNQIVLDGSGQAFDFCRDGDELHMHGVIDAGQASGIDVTLLLDFEPP